MHEIKVAADEIAKHHWTRFRDGRHAEAGFQRKLERAVASSFKNVGDVFVLNGGTVRIAAVVQTQVDIAYVRYVRGRDICRRDVLVEMPRRCKSAVTVPEQKRDRVSRCVKRNQIGNMVIIKVSGDQPDGIRANRKLVDAAEGLRKNGNCHRGQNHQYDKLQDLPTHDGSALPGSHEIKPQNPELLLEQL